MKNKNKKVDFGKIFGIAGKVLYWLIFTALIIIAGAIAISDFGIPKGYKILSVQSGSMEPAIKVGAIVVIRPENTYRLGEVITVKDPKYTGQTITHRIFEIKKENGITSYITKGDANNAPDGEERPAGTVLGKVLFTIPWVGYPIGFARTRDGLLVLIIIPATIIIYSELISIKNETIKLIKERRKRKLTLAEKAEVEVGKEEIKVEKWYQKLFKNR